MSNNKSFVWVGFPQAPSIEVALSGLVPSHFSLLERDALLAQLEVSIERLKLQKARRLIDIKNIKSARATGIQELRIEGEIAGRQRNLRLYFVENPNDSNQLLGLFLQLKSEGTSRSIRLQQNVAIHRAVNVLNEYLKGGSWPIK